MGAGYSVLGCCLSAVIAGVLSYGYYRWEYWKRCGEHFRKNSIKTDAICEGVKERSNVHGDMRQGTGYIRTNFESSTDVRYPIPDNRHVFIGDYRITARFADSIRVSERDGLKYCFVCYVMANNPKYMVTDVTDSNLLAYKSRYYYYLAIIAYIPLFLIIGSAMQCSTGGCTALNLGLIVVGFIIGLVFWRCWIKPYFEKLEVVKEPFKITHNLSRTQVLNRPLNLVDRSNPHVVNNNYNFNYNEAPKQQPQPPQQPYQPQQPHGGGNYMNQNPNNLKQPLLGETNNTSYDSTGGISEGNVSNNNITTSVSSVNNTEKELRSYILNLKLEDDMDKSQKGQRMDEALLYMKNEMVDEYRALLDQKLNDNQVLKLMAMKAESILKQRDSNSQVVINTEPENNDQN